MDLLHFSLVFGPYLLYACSMFALCLVYIESGIRSYISIEFRDKDFQ